MKNNKSNIRTGVIGIGSMGQNHARVYSEISNLVAIADPNSEQGKLVSERLGTTWVEDYSQILDKVDAVSISVPTSLHYTVAKEAISRGVNVLIEKPLASSSMEAEKILELAENNNVVLSVGHIERHNPVVRYAKDAIKSKLWGDLIGISTRRLSPYPNRISDVGVIFDFAIHDIDILRYLVKSEATSVYAAGGSYKHSEREDHASICINFASGICGISEVSWLTPIKVRDISLTFSTHFVQLNLIEQTIDVFNAQSSEIDEHNLFKSTFDFKKNSIKLPKEEPLMNEIVDFLNSISNSQQPLVTGNDGYRALTIAQASLDSMESNSLILL